MAACFDDLLTAALHAGLQVLCGRCCVYGVRLPFECAGQASLHHRNVCVCRAMHVQRLQQWVAQTWRERLSILAVVSGYGRPQARALGYYQFDSFQVKGLAQCITKICGA